MITLERIAEIAAHLRGVGLSVIADELACAHEGVFSGTELAMKWRFFLSAALKERRLEGATRLEVEHAWEELEAVLS